MEYNRERYQLDSIERENERHRGKWSESALMHIIVAGSSILVYARISIVGEMAPARIE